MTWRDMAVRLPEFVQWIVQTYGPLPDGDIRKEDYDRFALAYAQNTDSNAGGETEA